MAWTQTGNIRGPQGVSVTSIVADEGNLTATITYSDGSTGQIDLPQGPVGPRGEDGAGIQITGQVATYGDLPSGLGGEDAGNGFLVEADGLLYIWSGTAFPGDGQGTAFRGPDGPPGDRGPAGRSVSSIVAAEGDTTAVITYSDGSTANLNLPRGAQGVPGDQGDQGVRGSLWYSGEGVPGNIQGSQQGDHYLDTASGTVYRMN